MERILPASPPARGDLTQDAAAAMRALAGSTVEPFLVAAFPWFVTNPYQTLLYGSCREHGLAPVRVVRDEQLDEVLELQRAGLPTILHVHWLHPVLQRADSAKDARKLADAFLRRLDTQREAGGRIVWTVHNILPHEARFEAEEIRLSAEVAARSDVIHVLVQRTAELVAPHYELPEDRLLHVPHMSYVGAYEDHVSGPDARHALGLLADELVYLVLGAIRPYKGLPELLDAWATLPPDRPRRLVIAGAPSDQPGIDELIERAALAPDVLLDARKIPAPEMQTFLRAADVAVLPYRQALNSGALMLALTFGLPAIVPAGSGLAEVVDDRFGRTFDPASPTALADALVAAPKLATKSARAAATKTAAELSPAAVSRRFASGLRERLEGSASPPQRGVAPA
jgi:glycosyltransferase involved in cell wall biosynthesis